MLNFYPSDNRYNSLDYRIEQSGKLIGHIVWVQAKKRYELNPDCDGVTVESLKEIVEKMEGLNRVGPEWMRFRPQSERRKGGLYYSVKVFLVQLP